MSDWSLWINCKETRIVLAAIKELADEIKEIITDGSHLLEKDTQKISLDYTYSMGRLDGLREALEAIDDLTTEESKNDK